MRRKAKTKTKTEGRGRLLALWRNRKLCETLFAFSAVKKFAEEAQPCTVLCKPPTKVVGLTVGKEGPLGPRVTRITAFRHL